MNRNMGNTDRKIQGGIGLLIVSMIFWGPKTLWALLGLPILMSAVTGKSFVYPLIGVTTRPMSRWERIKARVF